MKLDPQTEDLTAYLKGLSLAWTGVSMVASLFRKAAARSAQRDEAREAAIELLTRLRD